MAIREIIHVDTRRDLRPQASIDFVRMRLPTAMDVRLTVTASNFGRAPTHAAFEPPLLDVGKIVLPRHGAASSVAPMAAS